jgi:hypothetical protein
VHNAIHSTTQAVDAGPVRAFAWRSAGTMKFPFAALRRGRPEGREHVSMRSYVVGTDPTLAIGVVVRARRRR